MTMISVYKKCKDCGCVYSWNPSVGKIGCPKCGSMRATNLGRDLSWLDILQLWRR